MILFLILLIDITLLTWHIVTTYRNRRILRELRRKVAQSEERKFSQPRRYCQCSACVLERLTNRKE